MVKKKKPVTHVEKIVVDTSQTIAQLGIQIPKINYKVIADATMQTAFNGMITPIPTVLIHHLRPTELLLIAVIIEETIEKGECSISQSELCDRMGVEPPTVASTRNKLIKAGVIDFRRRKNCPSIYTINWGAVNKLDALMKNEPRAIMARIRKVTKKRKMENINKNDIKAAYTEKILPFDHDPREEEMYD